MVVRSLPALGVSNVYALLIDFTFAFFWASVAPVGNSAHGSNTEFPVAQRLYVVVLSLCFVHL